MGLVIEEMKFRHPEWRYFDEKYQGKYPTEVPFSVSDLEEIYPCASAKTKTIAKNIRIPPATSDISDSPSLFSCVKTVLSSSEYHFLSRSSMFHNEMLRKKEAETPPCFYSTISSTFSNPSRVYASTVLPDTR